MDSRFLYAGAQAVGEYDSSGALIRRYVPGAGLDDYAAYTTGTGGSISRDWPVVDPLGSIVGITNGSATATTINTYDEYGVPGTFSGRFGYAGAMYLNRGLAASWNMRNRQYNPTLGRFMQTDPIGIEGGVNLYGYVGNDPVNLIDPWGLRDEEPYSWGECIRRGGTPTMPREGQQYGRCWYSQFVFFNPSMGGWGQLSGAGGGGNGILRPTCPAGNTPTSPVSRSPLLEFSRQTGALGQGVGDAFTFGLYGQAFSALPGGLGDTYTEQREAVGYDVGLYGATGVSAARLLYAGAASTLGALSGRSAVSARNSLKGAFSGLGSGHPRIYTYEQLLARYGSDGAVAAAAARTNPTLNAVAATGTVSGAAIARSCQ